MSISEWLTVVAALSGLWGVFVTFWSPSRLKLKVLALTPFIALAIIGWWLVRVQANQQKKAEDENARAQQELRQSVSDTQKQVIALQAQVNRVSDAMFQPGNASEKLDNVAKILGMNMPVPPVRDTSLGSFYDPKVARIFFYLEASSDRLVGAKVVATNESTNQQFVGLTDDHASVGLPLIEGLYTLDVTHITLGRGQVRVKAKTGETVWVSIKMDRALEPLKP